MLIAIALGPGLLGLRLLLGLVGLVLALGCEVDTEMRKEGFIYLVLKYKIWVRRRSVVE